jgi:hypothetical protein
MAASLPYLASNKNVPILFNKISAAKVPDKFTHSFLTSAIGLKGTNDRAFIPLLRTLGFIDQSGTPTPAYRLLKGHDKAGAIADGMKRAYAPLFDSDQDAQKLPSDRLKSLVAQVAGVDADATSRISGTFIALASWPTLKRRLTKARVPTNQRQWHLEMRRGATIYGRSQEAFVPSFTTISRYTCPRTATKRRT